MTGRSLPVATLSIACRFVRAALWAALLSCAAALAAPDPGLPRAPRMQFVPTPAGTYQLKRGKDPAKDQSYFLFALTQAQLITEIYNQRRYELLGTGLHWEDSRRRNLIRGPVAAPGVPLDGQRCWLPYALGDRNSNPNVPPDPAESTTFPSGCTY